MRYLRYALGFSLIIYASHFFWYSNSTEYISRAPYRFTLSGAIETISSIKLFRHINPNSVFHTSVTENSIKFGSGMCEKVPLLTSPDTNNVWSGWGLDEKNSSYQPNTGGLTAKNISHLKLKWVFGVPNVSQHRAQPSVYGNRLFMGSQSGLMFSLNAKSGCTYWIYKAEGGIRTANSLAVIKVGGANRVAVLFNDMKAYAYALDAETGALLWKSRVDDHQAASGSGALKYFKGRIYVPTSGLREEIAANRDSEYLCCNFRGSVTALDANTGEQLWKTYTLPKSQFVRKLENGKDLFGPAGGSVWSTPTIDAKRNRIYVTTGNAYAEPKVSTTNAIMALDLDTGKIVWATQTLEGDIYSGGCDPSLGGKVSNPGCVAVVGPDYDFSASPILTTGTNGEDYIIATQKSGLGYALDPQNSGKILWSYRWGEGSSVGGVYGASADGELAYFAVASNLTQAPGGMHGVDLETGQRVWFTPPATPLCKASATCSPAQTAAVTSIPGAVFSASRDGGIRAYDSRNGKILWTFDTNHIFNTINSVKASGGPMDGPGPIIVSGMLYVVAGISILPGNPANALLAFALESPVE